eukprot:SAG11_NODE_1616_length_4577_cov_1.568781_3_plen_70_part_00
MGRWLADDAGSPQRSPLATEQNTAAHVCMRVFTVVFALHAMCALRTTTCAFDLQVEINGQEVLVPVHVL